MKGTDMSTPEKSVHVPFTIDKADRERVHAALLAAFPEPSSHTLHVILELVTRNLVFRGIEPLDVAHFCVEVTRDALDAYDGEQPEGFDDGGPDARGL